MGPNPVGVILVHPQLNPGRSEGPAPALQIPKPAIPFSGLNCDTLPTHHHEEPAPATGPLEANGAEHLTPETSRVPGRHRTRQMPQTGINNPKRQDQKRATKPKTTETKGWRRAKHPPLPHTTAQKRGPLKTSMRQPQLPTASEATLHQWQSPAKQPQTDYTATRHHGHLQPQRGIG
ncbi:Hypothetical predicted protein [Pelobates cultripes]|uniref:Uncharacterized protein n=1 Tax=Pelobates cultripes TaxID=61616 RepID=A0AAD1VN71_PELCU|nr:Hypothetical predicted protein [Pelobates cultripes]